MTKTIEIDITGLENLFESCTEALIKRGFRKAEAEVWASIYIREMPNRVEETSEKIIELFGTNLFHRMDNVTHLAEKLKQHGLGFRAEQLVKELEKLGES